MTEKELKKLNRKQLLELLLEQTKRADRLEKQLRIARAKLAKRTIDESEAGSIAEAYFGVPEEIAETAKSFLDEDLLETVEMFYNIVTS